MSKPSLQPGTTLGIVVGSVFGLVVALLVALYLANSGAPVQSKADNTAARIEAPRDRNDTPDPNEFLYGKPRIEPVAVELTPEEQAAQELKAEAAAKAKLAAKNAAKAKLIEQKADKTTDAELADIMGDSDTKPKATKPTFVAENATMPVSKPSKSVNATVTAKEVLPKTVNTIDDQDAIGKIAAILTPANETASSQKAKPKAPSTDTRELAKTERYFVQVGAYANEAEAQAVKNKVAAQGIAMSISPREKGDVVLHRVRTASLPALEAERLRNTLKANGMEAALVKVQ
jgi:cell division protein FtsN